MGMEDIELMSDQELSMALRDYGLSVPVTANSRKLLERKLDKFLSGAGDVTQTLPVELNASADVPFEDAEEAAAEEPVHFSQPRPIVQPIAPSVLPHSQKKNESNATRRRVTPASDLNASRASDSDEGETSFRLLGEEERVRRSPSAEIRSPPVWKYAAYFVAALLFVAFLVFLNRNAQAADDDL
ncbi:hypothetical protein M3Y99_00348900 [Aphelenchoides fujianensis]|nr:hypothetical protein M3Y99_00348900 [Aphelenchoides fujianensis]